MKLILMTIMMLSLGLLTACGSSGGGGDPKADPVPAVPNDLDALDSVITADANENQLIALTISEYKDTNNYAFTGVDGDNVELSSEDGTVVFKVEADFETQPVYNFIMTVTNAAEQTKDIDVSINIIDIFEDLNSLPSVITESVNENHRFAFTIPEYKATNSYAFTGADGDKVKLWPERGEVIFVNAPDFETQPSYNFIMTVTNAIEQTKDVDVSININDVSNDFIFEVLAGSFGSLNLRLNHDEQSDFHDYSFTIKKDNGPEELIEFSGDIDDEFVTIKSLNADTDEVLLHRYTITPTTADSLPAFIFWANVDVVDIRVIQWGDNSWKSLHKMLTSACQGDESLFFDDSQSSPNLSRVNNMSGALYECHFNENFSYWDVSSITDMNSTFETSKGSADLSQWDVSSVEDMGRIFAETEEFNSDLSQWDVSSVKNMEWMFKGTKEFNSDISQWNVAKVESMALMFTFAEKFNADIPGWDVSSVKNMQTMFGATLAFNGDISSWIPSSVENMASMFSRSEKFNQNISGWTVGTVTNCGNFKKDALLLIEANTPIFTNCSM